MIDSTTYRMADALAEGQLAAILHEKRVERKLSFGRIARELYAEHAIEVTGQTVRNWCEALDARAAS